MEKVRHSVKAIREFEPLPEGQTQLVRIDAVEPKLRSYQYRNSLRFRAEVCAFGKRFSKNLDKWPCDIGQQRDEARRYALEVKGGDVAQGGGIKVSDFFWQEYLPGVRVRNKTAGDVEQRFKRFLDKYFGDRSLNKVTPAFLETLPHELLAHGYANQTVNHFLCDTRMLFKKAVENRRLQQSPARFLRNLPVSKAPIIPELTVERLKEFIKACEQDQSPVHMDYGIVLAGTGLRDSECRSIRIGQIDATLSTISIPENKAGRPFQVPVNSTVKAALQRRLEALGLESAEDRKKQRDTYLFASPVKPDAHISYARAFFARVSKRLGVTVKPHDLRRLWGVAVSQSTGSLDIASRMLNHSSLAVTKTYVTYAAPELAHASNLAERYLQGTQ